MAALIAGRHWKSEHKTIVMKKIIGIVLMLVATLTGTYAQNTDNTILGGQSDDLVYTQENSQPPVSKAFDNPKQTTTVVPDNSDNQPGTSEPSNPPSGGVTFDNPDYKVNGTIGLGNSDNNASTPEPSALPGGKIAYDNPPYNNNVSTLPADEDNDNTQVQPANPPAVNDAYAYNNTGDNNTPVYNNTGNDNEQPADVNPDDRPAPTYQTFHDQLSPYGTWVNVAGYGNVWRPAGVPVDFSPYATGGHWVLTEFGWTWVSDYAWGWAPFHYGRWFRDAAYGWLWAPGYQWAPAWVAWGSCGGYYCWAPLAPGFGFGYYRPAFAYWNFVPRGYIGYGHIGNYLVDRGRIFAGGVAHIGLINQAGSFRGNRFFAGPRAAEVAHYAGHPVNRFSMATVNHAVAQHFANQGQISRVNNTNVNHAPVANNYNRNSAPVNRNTASNNQAYRNTQQQNAQHQYAQPRGNYGNMTSRSQAYGNTQQANHYATPVQQHYTQQSAQRQNYQQHNYSAYNRQQPVQRSTERSFASAQRSSGAHYSSGYHGSSGGSHGGYSGGSHGGGGHGRR